MKKIVFTGGPCGGKTTLVELLERDYGPVCAAVPEAATILYGGGFPRAANGDTKRCAQRAIYYTQRELERLYERVSKARALLLDRGSMDGLAYWPPGKEAYLASVGSTVRRELARYDLIVHLRTPHAAGYQLRGVRTEKHRDAVILDRRIERAWAGHPRRYIIDGAPDFLTKVSRVLEILKAEAPEVFAGGRLMDGKVLKA